MVSKNLYSNPIGSIVREITSNGFDANISAGKPDEPVIISMGEDLEEGPYIEFQDFGTGMTPDIISTIYSNYFSSTKRGDNSQIGGWGLGSKTPLAYTELFYITTVVDKVKYEYIYHKGEDKPIIESFHGWTTESRTREILNPDKEDRVNSLYLTETYNFKVAIGVETEDANGTAIKIFIKNRDDRLKFSSL